MSIAEQLQKFLKQKFDELKLKRKDFIADSGVSSTTTSQIFNADFRNPDFNTILKMANYFNCPLDEVTARDKFSSSIIQNYQDLSSDQINQNLQNFINDKLQETGLSQYQLSRKLGFNSHLIYDFMQGNKHKPQKKLSSAVTIALADYFNVSLDEMTGRTPNTVQKTQAMEKIQTIPNSIQKLGTEDMEPLQQIKQSIPGNNQTSPSSSKFQNNKQPENSKGRTR